MAQKRKGGVSEETFDEFLADQGILGACEDHAVKELIAEQLAAAMEAQDVVELGLWFAAFHGGGPGVWRMWERCGGGTTAA